MCARSACLSAAAFLRQLCKSRPFLCGICASHCFVSRCIIIIIIIIYLLFIIYFIIIFFRFFFVSRLTIIIFVQDCQEPPTPEASYDRIGDVEQRKINSHSSPLLSQLRLFMAVSQAQMLIALLHMTGSRRGSQSSLTCYRCNQVSIITALLCYFSCCLYDII